MTFPEYTIDSTRASDWELFDTETRQSLRNTVMHTVTQGTEASVDNVNAQLGLGTQIGPMGTGGPHPCMFRLRSSNLHLHVYTRARPLESPPSLLASRR